MRTGLPALLPALLPLALTCSLLVQALPDAGLVALPAPGVHPAKADGKQQLMPLPQVEVDRYIAHGMGASLAEARAGLKKDTPIAVQVQVHFPAVLPKYMYSA